ncbi:PREDICTED: cytochrome b5, seed isoform-like [Nicotiana attenuata]|uniref:Cytochrome b5 n=1 Tax=Nicotiana attenuata TaxID=49451 RepID=A0A314KPE8_NICAT|nr:PREDICTED: cytochrome b5, seed isoform-like [Nicotiana attenuata]OIT30649.1 cytochrome b5 [Nicotiana attenuata]
MGANKNVLKTYGEVSLHNCPDDCWVIINAKAYNVTNFLNDHPGGDEVLLAAAGKDASEEFEEAGHGSAARLMLDEFYVGEIDSSTKTTVSTTTISSTYLLQKLPKIDKHKSSRPNIVKFITFLVPIVILGLGSTLLRFWY